MNGAGSGRGRTTVDEMVDLVDRHTTAFGREESAFLLLTPIIYEMCILGVAVEG